MHGDPRAEQMPALQDSRRWARQGGAALRFILKGQGSTVQPSSGEQRVGPRRGDCIGKGSLMAYRCGGSRWAEVMPQGANRQVEERFRTHEDYKH